VVVVVLVVAAVVVQTVKLTVDPYVALVPGDGDCVRTVWGSPGLHAAAPTEYEG
jgi:hypothetical protein